MEWARAKIRMSSFSSLRNAYKYLGILWCLTLKSQCQNFTSDHITSRSSWVKTGKNAYHSMRLDNLNRTIPRARRYLISVKSYCQKRRDMVTWWDMVTGHRNQNGPRSHPLGWYVKILILFQWFAMKTRPSAHETSQIDAFFKQFIAPPVNFREALKTP